MRWLGLSRVVFFGAVIFDFLTLSASNNLSKFLGFLASVLVVVMLLAIAIKEVARLRRLMGRAFCILYTLFFFISFISIFRGALVVASGVNPSLTWASYFTNKNMLLASVVPLALFLAFKSSASSLFISFLRRCLVFFVASSPIQFISVFFSDVAFRFLYFASVLLGKSRVSSIYFIAIIFFLVMTEGLEGRASLLRLFMAVSAVSFVDFTFSLGKSTRSKINHAVFYFYLFILSLLAFEASTGGDFISVALNYIANNFSDGITDGGLDDTRTFLYREVIDDVFSTGTLWFGKGAQGGYYSDYFIGMDGDESYRISAEVGFLSMLLRLGLIGCFIYISLGVLAIYRSLILSDDIFIKKAGYLLMVHGLMFFVESIYQFSFYWIGVWFLMGLCAKKYD